jgi:hypothetical protein
MLRRDIQWKIDSRLCPIQPGLHYVISSTPLLIDATQRYPSRLVIDWAVVFDDQFSIRSGKLESRDQVLPSVRLFHGCQGAHFGATLVGHYVCVGISQVLSPFPFDRGYISNQDGVSATTLHKKHNEISKWAVGLGNIKNFNGF